MIIKKIIMENIRSFEKGEVNFSQGSTLLAGDIGSGKTSVLLGIEFGLFGLRPGQRGSALLRNGEEQGGVKLEFEIDSKNILVERTLKREKTVSQDYSAITVDGVKEELSVTELKQRVLNLLEYPLEFSKKQNILYKFTVYTPQEEMKQIILEDGETRINTLRHVFGIDKYKTILENISLLRLKLREEKRLMEGITSTLEEDYQNILQKENELLGMKENTTNLETDLLLKIQNRKGKEREKEEIVKKIEEKNELRQEIAKSKIMLISKKDNFSINERKISELRKRIEEFESLKFDELKIQEIEEIILDKKKEREKLNSLNEERGAEISGLKIKIADNKKIQDKMSDLEICPTCHQNVDAIYRANVMNKAYNEISGGTLKIEELDIEKKEIVEKIGKLELDISFSEKELTDLKILKMKFEGIRESQINLGEVLKDNESMKKDIYLLEKHLETLNDSLFSLSKHDQEFLEKE